MNTQQIAAITAAVIAALNSGKSPKVKAKHKPISSYKPANKAQHVKAKADKVLSDGLTERQLKNDVNVAKAFAKQGFQVTPRVDALTYNGWLKKGMRVVKGQHGTFVKGVGTLFHSGQVAVDTQPTKHEMTAEVSAMFMADQSFPA